MLYVLSDTTGKAISLSRVRNVLSKRAIVSKWSALWPQDFNNPPSSVFRPVPGDGSIVSRYRLRHHLKLIREGPAAERPQQRHCIAFLACLTVWHALASQCNLNCTHEAGACAALHRRRGMYPHWI